MNLIGCNKTHDEYFSLRLTFELNFNKCIEKDKIMKKIIAALLISFIGVTYASENSGKNWHITLSDGEFIGMVDGYDQANPKKIIGKNIWQGQMTFNSDQQKKQIPVAYIITDKNKLELAWIGDAATGKEDVSMKKWLEASGYKPADLFNQIKPMLLAKNKITS
jgi:hypothetical protein